MTAALASLRASSRLARIGAIAAIVVLTAIPAALTLARDGTYRSSVEIRRVPTAKAPVLREVLALSAAAFPGYLRGEVDTDALRIGIVSELDYLVGADQLRGALKLVVAADRPSAIQVTADSPERARELARVAGLQMVAASSREVDQTAARALARARQALAGRPPPAERTALERRAALLRDALANPPSRVYSAPAPAAPRAIGVDADIERVLGRVPPRPQLAVAIGSGLAAGLLAALGMLAAGARRARRAAQPS